MNKIAIIILLWSMMSCLSSEAQNKVSAPDFQKKMSAETKCQLVDVRTPSEFQAGHLPKAQNINVYDTDFKKQTEKLNKKLPVYVYCKTGIRSSKAVSILKELGFQQIYELKGGYLAWQEAGLKVEKKQ